MLRQATEDDRDRALIWRNHPRVRETHFVQRVITSEEHARWWASAAPGVRVVLVYEHAGRPVGLVHFAKFDPGEASAHWGFFLDIVSLERGGELLPAWMQLEREAIDYAFDGLGLTILRGETLTSNPVVLQLHRRFGFSESEPFHREVDGIVHEAVMTELSATDRARGRARHR